MKNISKARPVYGRGLLSLALAGLGLWGLSQEASAQRGYSARVTSTCTSNGQVKPNFGANDCAVCHTSQPGKESAKDLTAKGTAFGTAYKGGKIINLTTVLNTFCPGSSITPTPTPTPAPAAAPAGCTLSQLKGKWVVYQEQVTGTPLVSQCTLTVSSSGAYEGLCVPTEAGGQGTEVKVLGQFSVTDLKTCTASILQNTVEGDTPFDARYTMVINKSKLGWYGRWSSTSKLTGKTEWGTASGIKQ